MRHSPVGGCRFSATMRERSGDNMTWIFGVTALLCVVYYGVIVLYSGFDTSFSFIWLLFAGALFLLAAGHEFYRRNPKKIPLWIPVSIVTFCLAGILIFCVVEALIFSGAASMNQPDLDYLIVLGAKVEGEQVSNSLKKRLDKAIEYLEQNPETTLVLSGGRGEGELVAEAQAMYDYLQFNGVSEDKMLLEPFSTSTVENIAYSRVAIEENEWKKLQAEQEKREHPLEIGVLTSNFHVYRAKKIAQKWGIPDIHGIASNSDPVLLVHFCVRECIAILKDKLMGNM